MMKQRQAHKDIFFSQMGMNRDAEKCFNFPEEPSRNRDVSRLNQ